MKPPRVLFLAYFFLTASSCAGSTPTRPIHRHDTHAHYIYHPAKTFHHLVGSHSGDNVTGIKDVKSYLQRFGYLNNHKDSNYRLDDSFDSSLERAVLTYQSFFKLNKTGVLDKDTISMMSKPRCGNLDIVNNSNINFPLSPSIRSRMLYKFAPGKPKRTKDELYVVIQNNVPSELVDAIRHAFADWEPYIPLQFLPTNEPGGVVPDIRVGFYKGDHGDGQAFDGLRGILAHSSFSLGVLHFNAEQYWTIGSNPFSYDVATIARHEIGHLLGLDHTDVHDALMYPTFDHGMVKGIGIDDEAGIRALYGT
ncbi:unnamed protein product [Rhodiola kirilowii]